MYIHAHSGLPDQSVPQHPVQHGSAIASWDIATDIDMDIDMDI